MARSTAGGQHWRINPRTIGHLIRAAIGADRVAGVIPRPHHHWEHKFIIPPFKLQGFGVLNGDLDRFPGTNVSQRLGEDIIALLLQQSCCAPLLAGLLINLAGFFAGF